MRGLKGAIMVEERKKIAAIKIYRAETGVGPAIASGNQTKSGS